ncbi:MAG: hypothetical protein M1839_008306 [Geoglossum umbratile]|nr:MAG: hypothetical protein M1839_008306 [Geoglossum umbratile]
MDGLSAAAGVIAVVPISGQVFGLCLDYCLRVKSAKEDIRRFRDEVASLRDVLAKVADRADAFGIAKLPALNLLNHPVDRRSNAERSADTLCFDALIDREQWL